MIFRLLVARPQVKNGLSWFAVRVNATRPLFRVQKTTVNVTTFTDVFFSMIACQVWKEGRGRPLPAGEGWLQEGPQG
jgi:hypothetical protein